MRVKDNHDTDSRTEWRGSGKRGGKAGIYAKYLIIVRREQIISVSKCVFPGAAWCGRLSEPWHSSPPHFQVSLCV